MKFGRKMSPATMLAIVFASLYLAIGPGCFFSVDEVVVQEMAQSVWHRGTLEVPPMQTARLGRGGAYYAHRGPALGYAAVPFVAIGSVLDNHFGSTNGDVMTGPPVGTLEQPFRWGGRFAIFGALIVNAIAGGIIVALLYLIALNLGADPSAAFLMAVASGLSTLVLSEATHFFGQMLGALGLLLGFWFFSAKDAGTINRRAWLGGTALGIAFLARANSAPAAAVIWLYAAMRASREAGDHKRGLICPAVLSVVSPIICVLLYLVYNYLQFGKPLDFGYTNPEEHFVFNLGRELHALRAYLFSPGLSLFLFAPPLLLLLVSMRDSIRRWPRETITLLLAAACELLIVISYGVWDGAIAYGPRMALSVIVLLMSLTIPVFERVSKGSWRWRLLVGCVMAAGLMVQLIGIAVYVTTNQWYRLARNLSADSSWVFTVSASPIVVQFEALLAGRWVIPWFTRALRSRELFPLLFLIVLLIVAAIGTVRILKRLRWDAKSAGGVQISSLSLLPHITTVMLALLVFAGIAITRPIMTHPPLRAGQLLSEAEAARQNGRVVAASETYALVLGLEPTNKFALYGLGRLYDQAGYGDRAVSLYVRALNQDGSFAPALASLARLTQPTAAAAPPPGGVANTASKSGNQLRSNLNGKTTAERR